MNMDRFFTIVIPLFLIFLADRILSALFVKWYLRLGVAVFSVSKDLPAAPAEWPYPKSLESRLRHIILGRTVFRDFGDSVYGFRFGGAHLMHGLLKFGAVPPRVRATAIVSIGTCLLILFWFSWTLVTGAPALALGGAGVFIILVAVDYGMLSRVLNEARRQCNVKMGQNTDTGH